MENYQAVVNIVEKLTKEHKRPCKKTLQKIIYLIESKDVDLGFRYKFYFYGPYSSDLDFAVRKLNDEDVLDIEYTPMEHNISVKDKQQIDNNGSNLTKEQNSIVDSVIKDFGGESSNELELLATAAFVYNETNDKETIKNGVKRLKGSKYNDRMIDEAISKLDKSGFLKGKAA